MLRSLSHGQRSAGIVAGISSQGRGRRSEKLRVKSGKLMKLVFCEPQAQNQCAVLSAQGSMEWINDHVQNDSPLPGAPPAMPCISHFSLLIPNRFALGMSSTSMFRLAFGSQNMRLTHFSLPTFNFPLPTFNFPLFTTYPGNEPQAQNQCAVLSAQYSMEWINDHV